MPSSPESSFQTRQLRLAQGQSLFEKMPRGTVIQVAVGAVVLVQRIYLDHATLVQHRAMVRGAVHGVQVSDWLKIVAQSDTYLVLRVPQPVSLRPLARALVAWLSRAVPRGAARPASTGLRSENRGAVRCPAGVRPPPAWSPVSP